MLLANNPMSTIEYQVLEKHTVYNSTFVKTTKYSSLCLRGRSQFFCHVLRHRDIRGVGGFAGCDAILQRDLGRSGRAVHCVLEHSLKVESTLPLVLGH